MTSTSAIPPASPYSRKLGQDQQVPDHDLGGRHQALCAVAYHPCLRGGQRGQCCDRAVGLDLLHHSDCGVRHDDERDDRGVRPVAGTNGEGSGDQQDQDQRVA
jgi:hypothetical protein